ncbi:DUF4124 domain-containing protein [Variovorax sp. Varisp85]|jgi:hypothetical protein|uniref:DUF4124 domain-containing protein n=1 Tax=unclassified Variovorax TaxID=663243 RepID=UPI00027101D1|nr:DUF4124 domain-containing protein [Variovorax sp. CF313]EJL80389.1 hypothetical protein PMI12_00057 [Variovorax sp. CF313]
MVKPAGAMLLAFGLMGFASGAMAQHSIYKCVHGGKVAYSNEPCPDAKKVEVKQTKGVNYEGRGSGSALKR